MGSWNMENIFSSKWKISCYSTEVLSFRFSRHPTNYYLECNAVCIPPFHAKLPFPAFIILERLFTFWFCSFRRLFTATGYVYIWAIFFHYRLVFTARLVDRSVLVYIWNSASCMLGDIYIKFRTQTERDTSNTHARTQASKQANKPRIYQMKNARYSMKVLWIFHGLCVPFSRISSNEGR